MGTESKSLWEQYNIGITNPDPGSGLINFMKNEPDALESMRRVTVLRIQALGIKLVDMGAKNRPAPKPVSSREKRIGNEGKNLLVELTALNEAMEYVESGILLGVKNTRGLKDKLVTIVDELIKTDQEDKLFAALDIVDIMIPQIVRALRVSLALRGPISTDDNQNLLELTEFANLKTDFLERHSALAHLFSVQV